MEKKVVKETVAHKPSEPDHKAESPVHKAAAPVHQAPAAKALADEIEKELETAKPAIIKKVEAKPRAEAKPEAKAAEKPAEPAAETKTPEPTGEVEAEIVEGAEEKKEAEKPKKKKGKKERKPHIKPQLAAGVVEAMALRKKLKDKTPNFIRQDAYNYGRLGNNWRKPQGTHSKLRHHINYRINVVSIGYGGPNASKGLHPSGFREVLVHHPLELDKVDPKTEAARIAHGVGVRKRMMIEPRAQRKGIRVLNEMQE